jgi:hypothetical protein
VFDIDAARNERHQRLRTHDGHEWRCYADNVAHTDETGSDQLYGLEGLLRARFGDPLRIFVKRSAEELERLTGAHSGSASREPTRRSWANLGLPAQVDMHARDCTVGALLCPVSLVDWNGRRICKSELP